MKKRTAKKTKRNPQDATLRNIRALQKRVTELEKIAFNHWEAIMSLKGYERWSDHGIIEVKK